MAFYEPFDPDYTRDVIEHVFGPIMEHYFRPRLLRAHRIPRNGPVIVAANHSGNAFPYDGFVLDTLLWIRDGMSREAKFRAVFEKQLAQTWWMRPFGLDNFWRRCGGVDMTFDNFERLLQRGERVIYFPEGVAGIGKGFHQRYRLQPFHTSFVVLAAKHRVPVVPVHIINAEWIIPFTFTLRPVDRMMQRLFRVPFLPLPAAPLGMVFPWAWWMAFPARIVLAVGQPIDVERLAREEGLDAADLDHPARERMARVAERVRRRMQRELERNARRYGRWPYQHRSLLRSLREARERNGLGRVLPPGWSTSFVKFARDRNRQPARSRLHAAMRDWDLAGYFLPFGWPLLSLTRAWRRPPYGYRGLTGDERRQLEGRFVWSLKDRPFPPARPEGELHHRVGS